MEEAITTQRYVRSVTGETVSSRIVDTGSLRIEMLKRTSRSNLQVHFRQPGLALFWFRKGYATFRGTVDGRPIARSFRASGNLAFFPQSVEIECELGVDPELDCAVVFFDPVFARSRLKFELENAQVAFTHHLLERGLEDLCREAAAPPDNVFELFAEGWADQALAHIFRVNCGSELERKSPRNPLSSSRSMRRIEEYVRDNVAEQLSLAAMSNVVGLSKRHFLRAFKEATGTTPHRFVLRVRIEEAKRRLIETNEAVTEVAFASGFGSSQRFATSFRSATGVTPSAFRLHHSA